MKVHLPWIGRRICPHFMICGKLCLTLSTMNISYAIQTAMAVMPCSLLKNEHKQKNMDDSTHFQPAPVIKELLLLVDD